MRLQYLTDGVQYFEMLHSGAFTEQYLLNKNNANSRDFNF